MKFPKTIYVALDDSEIGVDDPYMLAHGDAAMVLNHSDDNEEIAVYQLVSVNRLTVKRELVPKKKGRPS